MIQKSDSKAGAMLTCQINICIEFNFSLVMDSTIVYDSINEASEQCNIALAHAIGERLHNRGNPADISI